jgi:hypothetical protein
VPRAGDLESGRPGLYVQVRETLSKLFNSFHLLYIKMILMTYLLEVVVIMMKCPQLVTYCPTQNKVNYSHTSTAHKKHRHSAYKSREHGVPKLWRFIRLCSDIVLLISVLVRVSLFPGKEQ